MAYEKNTWIDNETPITAEKLNKMEQGIEDAGKTGGIEAGAVIGWTGEGTPEGYDDAGMGYSSEEYFTGKYSKDGKKVYGKEIIFDYTTANTQVNIPTNLTNVNELESYDFYLKSGEAYLKYFGTDVVFYMSPAIIYYTAVAWTGRVKVRVEYTKTTDTGNFKYIEKKSVTPIDPITGSIVDGTNIDDKEHNTYSANVIDGLVKDVYSTEEQVVGTWVDGKPIYRKVINGFFDTDIGYVVIDMSTSSDITNCYGKCQWNGFIIPLNFYWSDALKTLIQQSINDKKIYLAFGTELENKAYSLVVEYTKTTD